MPRTYAMTWLPDRLGWKKIHRGKTYVVSVRQLSAHFGVTIPPTKVESYAYANRWWEEVKRPEIEAANRPPAPLPLEPIAAAFVGTPGERLDASGIFKLLFSRYTDERRAVEEYLDRQAALESEEVREQYAAGELPPNEDPNAVRRQAIGHALTQLGKLLLENKPLPDTMPKLLPAAKVQAIEGLRNDATPAPEHSLAHWMGQHLREKGGGHVAEDRHRLIRRYLDRFVQFVGGPQVEVRSALDEKTLQAYYLHCREKIGKAKAEGGWAARTAADAFANVRSFLRWMVETKVIEPLSNLSSRRFKFKGLTPEPVHWTPEEIGTALRLATERMRLYVLLALNAGMGQKDVADLKPSEVDWEGGTITRFRSKAVEYKDRRRVSYRLWPETLRLLVKHRSKDKDRVLLSDECTPLWRVGRVDLIRTSFERLKKHLLREHPDFAGKSFYDLRKTAAHWVEQEFDRDTADLFLAHTPRTQTDKSYTREASQPRLDKALSVLREKLGIVDALAAVDDT